MIDANDHWVWRFHRDNSAWVRDPKVFIDRGQSMLKNHHCSRSVDICGTSPRAVVEVSSDDRDGNRSRSLLGELLRRFEGDRTRKGRHYLL